MTEFHFELKEAKKKAIPGLFSLWGPQGTGKTLSALLLARGLVGPKGKVSLIDSENGRALYYADHPDIGQWFHLPIDPPFSPEKYTAAFKYLEAQKMDAIVVDSASHVWAGTGGVLDMAEKKGGTSILKWKEPKIAHVRMMDTLLRSPIHVIFCLRAKDAVKQVGKEILSIGWQPICEKNLPYEMALDLRMVKDGKYDLNQSKNVPAGLRHIVTEGGTVSVAMGAKIAEWCGSGAAMDSEFITLKRDGHEAASQGVDSYKKWLAGLSKDQKEKVKNSHAEWSNLAKQADAEKSSQEYVIEDGKAASGN